ncbi:hypothetical protein [Vibrio coralliilyticus]|uniref:Uncharacterized protein n=1 Tax=Vibrio coralliilyticus TaxID=190893 RepID=A0AAP7DG33_9VIBR|nr:hypothetical protein [Vibrio coralliilyticus]NOI31812.1 hypothetical protein [Vibrio coralliilyticus]NOJ25255.1 hypothetical protein [Vibrio coralliilyticus]
MNVFKIKQSLEELRQAEGTYLGAKRLSRVDGGETLLLMNYQESLLVAKTIGKKPEQYGEIQECSYNDEYQNTLTKRLVYGHYRPQYGSKISHDAVKAQIRTEVNKWLVSITDDSESSFAAAIIDLKVVSEPIAGRCAHCEDKHETNFVAFAALALLPKEVELIDPKGEPLVLFLRHHDLSIVSDFYNREGIYVLNLEEEDVPIGTEITEENWQSYISLEKAKLFAQYI